MGLSWKFCNQTSIVKTLLFSWNEYIQLYFKPMAMFAVLSTPKSNWQSKTSRWEAYYIKTLCNCQARIKELYSFCPITMSLLGKDRELCLHHRTCSPSLDDEGRILWVTHSYLYAEIQLTYGTCTLIQHKHSVFWSLSGFFLRLETCVITFKCCVVHACCLISVVCFASKFTTVQNVFTWMIMQKSWLRSSNSL